MFEWLWGCMMLSLKATVGCFSWMFLIVMIVTLIGLGSYLKNRG